MSLNLNNMQARGGSFCLTYATLAINAASAATFKTTGTTTYCIDGILYTKAALSAQAFTAGHTALAASQQCTFGVWVDSAGTISTTQGRIVSSVDVTNKLTAVPWPDYVANRALIGVIEVKTGATTFTPGTTALDAANVTATYFNTFSLPSGPLTT